VKLSSKLPVGLAGLWLPIWGGGTLVFDADGALRHHAQKPVTQDRVRDVMRFVGDIVGSSLIRSDASPADRLLTTTSAATFVASIAGDRVSIRGNPAARCGSRPSQGLLP
jgi:hypothetical protein